MRSWSLAVLVLAAVALGAVGCGGDDSSTASTGGGAAASTKLTVGLPVATDFGAAMPMWVAKQQGFFKREGLDVSIISFQGGADAVKALLGDSIQIDAGTGFDGPATVAQGGKVKVFAGYMQKSDYVIVARNGGPAGPADLDGKRVAITRFGSSADFVVKQTARSQGLAPDAIKEVALGAPEVSLAAVKRGDVDAMVGNAATEFQVQNDGAGKVAGRFSEIFPGDQRGVFLAGDDYLTGHADTVKAFLQAYRGAVEWMQTHPKETIASAVKNLKLDPASAAFQYGVIIKLLTPDGVVNTKGMETLAKALPALKIADTVPPLDSYYTPDFTPIPAPDGA